MLLTFVGCGVACFCYCKRSEARNHEGTDNTLSMDASRSAEQPRVSPQPSATSAAVQPSTLTAASRSVSNRSRIPTEVIPHEKLTFKGPITCFQLQRVNLVSDAAPTRLHNNALA